MLGSSRNVIVTESSSAEIEFVLMSRDLTGPGIGNVLVLQGLQVLDETIDQLIAEGNVELLGFCRDCQECQAEQWRDLL